MKPLAALAQLTALNVSENPIADPGALAGLPGMPKPAFVYPSNWVKQLPRTDGKAGKSSGDGAVGRGSFSYQGTISSFTGAVNNWQIPGTDEPGGGVCALELSVEKGHVRAYLEYLPENGKFLRTTDGYVFAEAEPGKPGKAQGFITRLGSSEHTNYEMVFESLYGEAQGVKYRIYRLKGQDWRRKIGGRHGIRTHDPHVANVVLSQLS